MFDNQFDIADQVIGNSAKPVMLYAVETAIQLALAEINEKHKRYLRAGLYAA